MSYGTPSPFPPSFEGSPFSYGFGLFGDVFAAAISLTMLLAYVFEARRARQISIILRNPVPLTPQMAVWSPLFLYRAGKISILAFVVLRTLPDAIWMLAWGEVSDAHIRMLLALDLVCDGVAIIPLMLSTFCWAWGRQIIPQLLIDKNNDLHPSPRKWPWDAIFRNGRIALMVMIIAIGVTIGKASV